MQNEIPINKNYDDMNQTILSKKKPYQVLSIALAFVIGGIIMVFLRPVLGTTVCSYIALIVVMPLGFLGLYERHGMDLLRYIKVKKQIRLYGKLFYDLNPLAGKDNSTETDNKKPVILSPIGRRILKTVSTQGGKTK